MIRRASGAGPGEVRPTVTRGAIGRCTRGVILPRAQVSSTGMVANAEASADRGTSTLHVETTSAVTMRGAEVDCACTSAGPAAKTAAARAVRTMTCLF